MNKIFVITGALFVGVIALTSASAQSKQQETAAINFVKGAMVSTIESGMPRERFDTWFRRIAGKGMKIHWEVNDCGEQTGTPADRGRDFPMCVEAKAEAEASAIDVTVQVGTFKRGIVGRPAVRGVGVNEEGEERTNLNKLNELTWTLSKLRGRIVK